MAFVYTSHVRQFAKHINNNGWNQSHSITLPTSCGRGQSYEFVKVDGKIGVVIPPESKYFLGRQFKKFMNKTEVAFIDDERLHSPEFSTHKVILEQLLTDKNAVSNELAASVLKQTEPCKAAYLYRRIFQNDKDRAEKILLMLDETTCGNILDKVVSHVVVDSALNIVNEKQLAVVLQHATPQSTKFLLNRLYLSNQAKAQQVLLCLTPEICCDVLDRLEPKNAAKLVIGILYGIAPLYRGREAISNKVHKEFMTSVLSNLISIDVDKVISLCEALNSDSFGGKICLVVLLEQLEAEQLKGFVRHFSSEVLKDVTQNYNPDKVHDFLALLPASFSRQEQRCNQTKTQTKTALHQELGISMKTMNQNDANHMSLEEETQYETAITAFRAIASPVAAARQLLNFNEQQMDLLIILLKSRSDFIEVFTNMIGIPSLNDNFVPNTKATDVFKVINNRHPDMALTIIKAMDEENVIKIFESMPFIEAKALLSECKPEVIASIATDIFKLDASNVLEVVGYNKFDSMETKQIAVARLKEVIHHISDNDLIFKILQNVSKDDFSYLFFSLYEQTQVFLLTKFEQRLAIRLVNSEVSERHLGKLLLYKEYSKQFIPVLEQVCCDKLLRTFTCWSYSNCCEFWFKQLDRSKQLDILRASLKDGAPLSKSFLTLSVEQNQLHKQLNQAELVQFCHLLDSHRYFEQSKQVITDMLQGSSCAEQVNTKVRLNNLIDLLAKLTLEQIVNAFELSSSNENDEMKVKCLAQMDSGAEVMHELLKNEPERWARALNVLSLEELFLFSSQVNHKACLSLLKNKSTEEKCTGILAICEISPSNAQKMLAKLGHEERGKELLRKFLQLPVRSIAPIISEFNSGKAVLNLCRKLESQHFCEIISLLNHPELQASVIEDALEDETMAAKLSHLPPESLNKLMLAVNKEKQGALLQRVYKGDEIHFCQKWCNLSKDLQQLLLPECDSDMLKTLRHGLDNKDMGMLIDAYFQMEPKEIEQIELICSELSTDRIASIISLLPAKPASYLFSNLCSKFKPTQLNAALIALCDLGVDLNPVLSELEQSELIHTVNILTLHHAELFSALSNKMIGDDYLTKLPMRYLIAVLLVRDENAKSAELLSKQPTIGELTLDGAEFKTNFKELSDRNKAVLVLHLHQRKIDLTVIAKSLNFDEVKAIVHNLPKGTASFEVIGRLCKLIPVEFIFPAIIDSDHDNILKNINPYLPFASVFKSKVSYFSYISETASNSDFQELATDLILVVTSLEADENTIKDLLHLVPVNKRCFILNGCKKLPWGATYIANMPADERIEVIQNARLNNLVLY